MNNPLRVTFDSNVWRYIASPYIFPNEPSINDFLTLRSAIVEKNIIACLSETTFTLETIKKTDRRQTIASYTGNIEIRPSSEGGISIQFDPLCTHHMGNNSIIQQHYNNAIEIGFRILQGTRIGRLKNKDVMSNTFLHNDNTDELTELMWNAYKAISDRGCGIAQLKAIATKYAHSGHWRNGLKYAPEDEQKNIVKAVAEWADGDSVAAHIAYKNDYYCTRDIAKSSGSKSIFSPVNREWLKQTYGMQFVLPEELTKLIKTSQ